MIRNICLGTVVLLAASSAIALNVSARERKVLCEVLLPAAPVPGDEGSYLTILHLTVPPGHDAHLHMHAAAEYLTVVSGTGSLMIEGRGDIPLRPGDIVTIPPKVAHQQHNQSDTEPLVYTSTFVGHVADPLLTKYVGEPDRLSGCPHTHKVNHN